MDKNNAEYWIWLTIALGFNNPKCKKIYEQCGQIQDFYNGRFSEWILWGIFSEKELASLGSVTLKDAENVIEKCNAQGFRIITFDDLSYPETLMHIYAPPCVLYVKGTFPDFENKLSISIVGTRKASEYGVKSAFEMAYSLSKTGVIIVSGGALGIDCSAHRGVLSADGITAAVLGCGINTNYLHENKDMRNAIAVKGALISEYPPDTPARSYHFPERNRLISGLSQGTVIIEAGTKSGSLITAGLALEQGRDVFAVMANIDSPQSFGSNRLIKEGAVPVTGYKDIIQFYFSNIEADKLDNFKSDMKQLRRIPVKKEITVFKEKTTGKTDKINQSKKVKNADTNSELISDREDSLWDLSREASQLLQVLSKQEISIDTLISVSGMMPAKVLKCLTELELSDLVQRVNGHYYRLKT